MTLQYELMNEKLLQVSAVLDNVQDRDDNIYRVIFEAEPIPSSIRKAGIGGVNRYEKLEGTIIQSYYFYRSKTRPNIKQFTYNLNRLMK